WFEETGAGVRMAEPGRRPDGELPVALADTRLWQRAITLDQRPHWRDHRMGGRAVAPIADHIEMMVEAGRALFPGQGTIVRGLRFEQPLTAPEDGGAVIQIAATDIRAASASVFIASAAPDGGWIRHASATLVEGMVGACNAEVPPSGRRPAADDADSMLTDYERWAELGLEFGPAIQAVARVWRTVGGVAAALETIPDERAPAHLDPALLEAAFHPLTALEPRAFAAGAIEAVGAIESIAVHRP